MRKLSKMFKALSDPNRIRIMKMLELRPLCVCEITEVLKLASSTVSKHLSILRDAELILDQKEGKWVYYRLNDNKSELYAGEMVQLMRQWLSDSSLVVLDHKALMEKTKEDICNI